MGNTTGGVRCQWEACYGKNSVRVEFEHLIGSVSHSVQTILIKSHHPGAEQFDASAAIHSPLDGFQSIDLALRLPVAPGIQHRVSHSIKVLTHSSREALHGIDA
jgi:hypothetical protein